MVLYEIAVYSEKSEVTNNYVHLLYF